MVVILLILINILFYFTIPYEYYSLLGLNILFFKGAYWQILSSMFIHGNLTHLILNMIVLFQFGRILEPYLGAFRFFLLYIIGGIMCSILSAFYVYFSFNQLSEMINLVGASGAICVLMGYYAFLDKSSTKGLIVAILLMSFAPLLMGVNVAWYGHIFGFICGYFLGKLRRKNLKKIYILRHAKAVKNEEVQDFDRKLSKRGKEDLEKLFYNLKFHKINFDFILSSPSKRTAKTAKKIAKFYNFDKEKIQFIDELYLADLSKIYQILQTIDKKYNEVLLVGHNPTLMELGEYLGSLCLTSFPTSSMLCLEFDIEDFKDLKAHSGKVIFFEHVRKLKEEKELD